jgi:hypothetical protein
LKTPFIAIIAALLILPSTSNAGSWIRDDVPCGSKCPTVPQQPRAYSVQDYMVANIRAPGQIYTPPTYIRSPLIISTYTSIRLRFYRH